DFLTGFNLPSEAASHFKNELKLTINGSLSERKTVDLGRILGRILCIGYGWDVGGREIRKDLIEERITTVRHSVSSLVSSFKSDSVSSVVEDYSEESSWLKFV